MAARAPRLLPLACLAALAAAPGPARAEERPAAEEPPFRVSEHYTKYEYRIPMRDGVTLFTVVHVPKDGSRTYPILLLRTPYGVGVWEKGRRHYGVDFMRDRLGPSEAFERAGYVFVEQDVRGRFRSGGTWQEMQPQVAGKRGPKDADASTDTWDTVEWLLKHVPGHNGRVGIWGISYPGFYAAAGIIDGHPAIKAASPQAPAINLYANDDVFHNGAFMLAANQEFFSAFGRQENPTEKPDRHEPFEYGTTSGYDYLLKLGSLREVSKALPPASRPLFDEGIDHPTWDDYWKARDLAPHLKGVRCAVLTVGGWFDAEDPQGPLTTFREIGRNNPGTPNQLVMGPWVHGGWLGRDGARIGQVSFAAPTAEQFRTRILFPFFEHYLRGEGKEGQGTTWTPGTSATIFETGTNVWRRFPAWPPPGAQPRTLWLQPAGGLAFTPPPAAAAPAFDEWRSDPARPVPFSAEPVLGVPQAYVVADQRFAATRPDVLVYQTEPLEEDVTVVGPIEPRLFVSTSGEDGDWVVKLIDVYPEDYPEPEEPAPAAAAKGRAGDVEAPRLPMGGYQQLVRGEPMRGRYRSGFDRPAPFVPGEVAALSFRLPDVAHTFRRGHRIMVQVQGSWFPLVDRNPQTFVTIADARPEDFKAATQRVYRSGATASGIQLRVLPAPGR